MRAASSKTLTPDKARIRVQDLCARAEHCEGEIRRKLHSWGITADEANDIIDELKHLRFIDDRRFAGAFVRDKVRFARWGRRKISMSLCAKGISKDIINDAFNEITDDEYSETLLGLLKAKVRTNKELISTYEGRTRLYRFAMQRGFETPIITQCIKSLLAQSA